MTFLNPVNPRNNSCSTCTKVGAAEVTCGQSFCTQTAKASWVWRPCLSDWFAVTGLYELVAELWALVPFVREEEVKGIFCIILQISSLYTLCVWSSTGDFHGLEHHIKCPLCLLMLSSLILLCLMLHAHSASRSMDGELQCFSLVEHRAVPGSALPCFPAQVPHPAKRTGGRLPHQTHSGNVNQHQRLVNNNNNI